MNIQDVILGLLCEKPQSGYEIKRHFEEYFSFSLMLATALSTQP